MRVIPRFLAVACVVLLSACATSRVPADPVAAESAVMHRAQLLMDRYARNDQAGVVAMLDPERVTMLGTSFNEKVTSPAGLRALMDRDFAQWKTASLTDVREADVRIDGNLATAYFVVTFSAEHAPTLPLRMFTTWRRVNGEWLLTQSGTALPPPG
jgi:hypothetical protein